MFNAKSIIRKGRKTGERAGRKPAISRIAVAASPAVTKSGEYTAISFHFSVAAVI